MANSKTVEEIVQCPSCKTNIRSNLINLHLDDCLEPEILDVDEESDSTTPKRMRLTNDVKKDISPFKNFSTKKTIDTSSWGSLGKTRMKKEPAVANNILQSPNNLSNGKTPRASTTFAPLADQMRPSTLEDYRGQEKVIAEGTMLRKLLEKDEIPSMILWGPPGCGKTSMAHVIASQCKKNERHRFVSLSATTTGVKEVKDIVDAAKNEQRMLKRKTVLFFDEIHRFNKLQQDVFLPAVENGTIILIGATTENPSFTLNSALLSRCRVFVLDKLSNEHIETILHKALNKLEVEIVENGCNAKQENGSLCIEKKALQLLADFCDGDARTALNSLQMAEQSKRGEEKMKNDSLVITERDVKESLQRSHLLYDRKGDQHYDIISAFIKSMRGSDRNAALYWLARMVEGGEDPRFIARRLVVFASEDVGLADPTALTLAVSTFQSCQTIGLPECRINLAHCAVYLAQTRKSRESYEAYAKAEECVRNYQGPVPSVPLHLRNAPTKLMKELGYGKGNNSELGFMPESLKHVTFFR